MNAMEASWVGLVEFANELEPDPDLQELSDEQVEQQVRDGASRIAAMQCEWLAHVAELVVRGAWADQGARTPGQWLSWACGEASSTAREHVRVALALRHLPAIRARFAEGTISYSKVRAITRVATPEIEGDLLRFADSAPASILVGLLAKGRRSADLRRQWEEGPPAPGEVRDLRRIQVDEDTVELRVRLPVDEAVAVEERLDRLVDLADRTEAHPELPEQDTVEHGSAGEAGESPTGRPSRSSRRAAALCDAVATAVAAGPPDRSGADDHLVVVHVDVEDLAAAAADTAGDRRDDAAEALDGHAGDGAGAPRERAGDAAEAPGVRSRPGSGRVRAHVATGRNRGMMLPRSVLARLTCDAQLRLAGVDADGHPADIGRRSREVPADLRRALLLRDRHCRFPGCHQTRGLHAHHVVHWAAGGPTDLSNLVLLCAHHHRFVHDAGWTLQPVAGRPGRWTFHAPGQPDPLPAVLAMPGASAASATTGDPIAAPPGRALQPPWWDGAAYDVDETVGIIADLILDVAA